MKISFCKTIMWQAIAVFAMVAGLSSCERDVAVTGVSLNKESITLKVGETQTLIATVTPDNATVKDVTWSSDDKAIATVDEEGNVKAVSEGIAFIAGGYWRAGRAFRTGRAGRAGRACKYRTEFRP